MSRNPLTRLGWIALMIFLIILVIIASLLLITMYPIETQLSEAQKAEHRERLVYHGLQHKVAVVAVRWDNSQWFRCGRGECRFRQGDKNENISY